MTGCRKAIRSTTRCRLPRTRAAAGCSSPGRGHGFFYSLNDGKTWTQFKDKLPAAPVNWIEVPKNASEVAVATYGRGLWILRDVWQLENEDAARRSRPSCSSTSRCRHAVGQRRHAEFVFSSAAPTSPITMEIIGSRAKP